MLCGYLSPKGEYFECDSYGHMDLAKELAETFFDQPYLSGVKAEDLLFENGYVCFTGRGASFRFNPFEGVCLSDKQRTFIEDNLPHANNEDQASELKDLLRWDSDIREESILSRAEDKFLSQ